MGQISCATRLFLVRCLPRRWHLLVSHEFSTWSRFVEKARMTRSSQPAILDRPASSGWYLRTMVIAEW